jgi:hypothetical protein
MHHEFHRPFQHHADHPNLNYTLSKPEVIESRSRVAASTAFVIPTEAEGSAVVSKAPSRQKLHFSRRSIQRLQSACEVASSTIGCATAHRSLRNQINVASL